MGRTAKNTKSSFGGTPLFNGKEPLKVFSWLRKFVKACDDNDVSEGMGLYLIPNFLAGDAEGKCHSLQLRQVTITRPNQMHGY